MERQESANEKPQFSGHESFHCRQYWLKKGFDFIQGERSFSEEDSVVRLGVGKNMVTAIQYWLRAFGLLNEKSKPTELAERIFSKEGWDPYLENDGTLWLLHFDLVRRNTASIFNLIFNNLRKTKPEFEEKHFQSLASTLGKFSPATLSKDFAVFRNSYLVSSSGKNEIEDNYSGIFAELNLINAKAGGGRSEILVIESKRRPEVPPAIALYCILKNAPNRKSLDFEKLYSEKNNVGSVFALSREGLVDKLEEITQLYPKDIVLKSNSGQREIQFKKALNPFKVLSKYYAR